MSDEGKVGADAELREWWMRKARGQVEGMLPKLREYGGHDLEVIGRAMLTSAGMENVSKQVATEAGIAFYIQGKLARVLSAAYRGEPASEDTWHDICVYAGMGARANEVGGFPS